MPSHDSSVVIFSPRVLLLYNHYVVSCSAYEGEKGINVSWKTVAGANLENEKDRRFYSRLKEIACFEAFLEPCFLIL